MIKRKMFGIGFVCFILLSLMGCNTNQHSANSNQEVPAKEVKHELGTSKVPEKPDRVVTLEMGITETVATLGVKPVGVADDDRPERIAKDTYEKIKGYTSVGKRSQPNLEVIRTLNPDLIIIDADRHEGIYEEFKKIAPTIALKDDEADYTYVLNSTNTIGKALGKEEEANQLISDHNKQIEELKQELDLKNKKVLQAGYSEGNIFETPTTSFFMPSFLSSIGISYALEDDKTTSKDLTIEQLLKINPDILLVTLNEEAPSAKETLKMDKLWNKLKAVEANQVFEVDHNDWSRRRSIPAVNDRMKELEQLFVTKIQQ